MQNELFIQDFVKTGSVDTLMRWIQYLKSGEWYDLAVFIGELVFPLFSYHVDFLDLLGMCYYYSGHYRQSWDIYMDILSSTSLSEERQKAYFFNAHFSIPYLANPPLDERIINQIIFNAQPMPLVSFSITTCKRFDLFERTMNSFLACCEDIHLITHWICVDDNSSAEDRIKMKEKYPFFDFVWKTSGQKGHANSMNIILEKVKTPYLFHLEDDWHFHMKGPLISKCLHVLGDNPMYGQCLLNKNYAETADDIKIVGGQFMQTKFGLRYYVHEHFADASAFVEKYGSKANCAYWAHYSLRPGLNRTQALIDVGAYDSNAPHFEMNYAYRFMNKGYKTTFLDTISCTHIGRLTSERNDNSKLNAYALNDESQFVAKEVFPNWTVVNLKTRPDRLEEFKKKLPLESGEIYSAIHGHSLKPSRHLEQLFNSNDYNYRLGMMGCALSHISLWMRLVEPSIQMIFEDDIRFVPYFKLKVEHIMDQLKNVEWDIIFLGHHLYDKYKTKDTYDEFKMPTAERWSTSKSLQKSIGGTGGYIISANGAEKMLSFIQEKGMMHGIDTMMQKACDSLNIFYCTPHLIYSDCYTVETMDMVDTDIQRDYDSLKRDLKDRIKDEFEWYQRHNCGIRFCEAKGSDDDVIVCGCGQCASKGVQYAVENLMVFVPQVLVDRHPHFADVAMKVDQRWSMKNLISI